MFHRIKRSIYRIGIVLFLFYTAALTILRAVRYPNDYAQAHWLLDYRFGFIKRGLVGSIVSLLTSLFHLPINQSLISALSIATCIVYFIVILYLALRIIQRSNFSASSLLITTVFLSSPFIVMSGHLLGYFDNIIIVMGILSIILLFKGKIWPAVCIQGLAILVHENSLLINFPIFCLAWIQSNRNRNQQGLISFSIIPLLIPITAFFTVAAGQTFFLKQDFNYLLMSHLSRFEFAGHKFDLFPALISTTFAYYFAHQKAEMSARIFSASLFCNLFTILTLLYYVIGVRRIRAISTEFFVLMVICFSPQLMHLVAWDTARIWTYTVLSSFLALWVYSENHVPFHGARIIKFICMSVFVLNILIEDPLMDGESEYFRICTRLFFFVPVIVASLIFVFSKTDTYEAN